MTEPPSADLTTRERAAYQSLVSRGHSREDALEGVLDGVDARDLRESDRRKKP